MKKFIALLMAAIMVLSLAACSGQDANTDGDEQGQEQTPDEGSDTTTPDDGSTTPDDNAAAPDDDTAAPDEGAATDDGNTPATDGGSNQAPTTPDGGSTTPDSGTDGNATPSLSSTMATILDGVADLPMVGDVPLDSTNFEFYAFIPYQDGYAGLASDAMINAVAHSVVLVEVPDGTDVQSVADSIEANANPNKWICVSAEKTAVAVNGNLILLVMSSTSTCDAIVANFEAL